MEMQHKVKKSALLLPLLRQTCCDCDGVPFPSTNKEEPKVLLFFLLYFFQTTRNSLVGGGGIDACRKIYSSFMHTEDDDDDDDDDTFVSLFHKPVLFYFPKIIRIHA
jgi:hypothetical protein